MKTFNTFINEAKLSSKGFTFTITHYNNNGVMYISFIPDAKTFDSHSKNQMAEFILNRINNIKALKDAFVFRLGNQGAGIVFEIDVWQLVENISKEIK